MTSKVFLRDATEVRLVFPLRGYVWSFSSRCLLGPDLRVAAVRRTGHGQPHRRRADRWRQRLFDQAQGLAAYWCSSESPPVGSSLAPSYTLVRLTLELCSRLLDVQLSECIEGTISSLGSDDNLVLQAMQALLTGDGLSS